VPIVVLAAAMALVAFNVVPLTLAFFGAAVVLLLARSLSLREAYDAIEWPILIMLGALIPSVMRCARRAAPISSQHGFRTRPRRCHQWGRSLCCLPPPWL